jgi:CelD/BcsL family acetyltransferase involved in cellulose biosynthesis
VTQTQAQPGTRLVVARTAEEIEGLRESWSRLQPSMFLADPDHFLTFLRSRPTVIRPHVVLLERDGEPRALAVARIEDQRLPAKVGYKTVLNPKLRVLVVGNGGFVAPGGEVDARALLDELSAALSRGEAELLRLRLLPLDSPAHRLAKTLPSFARREHVSAPIVHWRLKLPASLDEFLKTRSSRTRGNLRRYARKLVEEYGDRLVVDVVDDPAQIDRLFADTMAVARKTYQHGLDAGFADTPERRALVGLELERGWFRGYVLSIDGVPQAFWHGTAYRGTFFTGATGYDPELRNLRLGTFILMRMIDDLCRDETIDVVDYGIGDAEYKRIFGDESWLEEDVHVFAPRLRPIAVNAARSAVLAAAGVARRVVEERGLAQRLKRGWRGRLSAPAQDGAPAKDGGRAEDA